MLERLVTGNEPYHHLPKVVANSSNILTKKKKDSLNETSMERLDDFLASAILYRQNLFLRQEQILLILIAGWGYAVAQLVEALRYKPEGHGFDSQWCQWNFSLTQSFQPHYDPDSASNRNEYQEYFLGVKAAGAYG